MADPVSATLLAVSLGTTVAGGVMSATGKAYESKAQANMYEYQSGMAQINKQIQEQNANYARSVGEVEAQKSGMGSRFRAGQIKVAQGASGIDVNSGTSVNVRESQEAIGRQDQTVIRANAAKQAYGYEVEAIGAEGSAGMYKAAASNARTAGDIGVASSLISTAGSVASKWYGAKSSFGGGSSGSAHNSGVSLDY